MNAFSHVPPGFRFHPTDEELVDYYLRKKIASREIDLDVIKVVDLHRIEPWDLQEKCRIGAQEESEWYFFSHKDKKYPTGTRTNRATTTGFWKATGRDKPIFTGHSLIGMRKTLVFYQGRAPNGRKSDWIMHEYRLETSENAPPQEEGWVVCRVFKKRVLPARTTSENEHLYGYSSQIYFTPDFDPPSRINSRPTSFHLLHGKPDSCKREFKSKDRMLCENFIHLPQLESPTIQGGDYAGAESSLGNSSPGHDAQIQACGQQETISLNNYRRTTRQEEDQQITDWRVFDKLVASQLSPGDALEGDHYPDPDILITVPARKEHMADHGSTSSSNNLANVWK